MELHYLFNGDNFSTEVIHPPVYPEGIATEEDQTVSDKDLPVFRLL